MSNKLIIFDADGTFRRCIVPGRHYPHKEDEWELLEGVKNKISELIGRDIKIGVASNQPGVAKEYFSEELAKKLIQDMTLEAGIRDLPEEAVQICPHLPGDGCSCRKPEAGMLKNIMKYYSVTERETLFVGDRDTDKQAAENAGCEFMWAQEFWQVNTEGEQ